MTLRERVLEHLKELGAAPKRSLGQNFLISDTVVQRILDAAKKLNTGSIVEVGPGLGALTLGLQMLDPKLLVIEMDRAFAERWRSTGLEVLEQDALKIKWSELQKEAPYTLVSNLPYQISSRLIVDITATSDKFENMVLMFQKEVAERCAAQARTENYGLLSVFIQIFWNLATVTDAGPKDFFPAPNVGSRVLSFQKRSEIGWNRDQRERFLVLVKAAFAQRRKLLIKNLVSFDSQFDFGEALTQMGFLRTVRAEELAPQDFKKLFETYLCGKK